MKTYCLIDQFFFIKKQLLGLNARITSWDPTNRIPREQLYIYIANCSGMQVLRIYCLIICFLIGFGLPDLPIPTRTLESAIRPQFLNPNILQKTAKTSRLLTAERKNMCRTYFIRNLDHGTLGPFLLFSSYFT